MLEAGLSPAEIFSGGAGLSKEIEFALEVGAPLKPTLVRLDQIEISKERASRELRQALAVPKATRRLLLWLPLLSAGMGQLVGLSDLGSFANPLVLFSLLLAAGLILIGAKLTQRQLRSVESVIDISNLQRMLIAVSAGMGLTQIGARLPAASSDPSVSRLLNLSAETGAALIPLIDGEIERALGDQIASQIESLRQLSVRILIPLGLTTLPAFMLLTIPPILVGSIK